MTYRDYMIDSTISIHAPREGGDNGDWDVFWGQFFISIHAPREGGDIIGLIDLTYTQEFQSTPPARGATTQRFTPQDVERFQSTPPARGATLSRQLNESLNAIISIHAPREGGDESCNWRSVGVCFISIHAPREGGD